MASNALAPLVYQLQEGLRNVDLRNFINTDLSNWFDKLDFKTVSLVALAVLAVLFVLEFFTKSLPFRRNLAYSAADAWDNAHNLQQVFRDSRSLEPVKEVLDALSGAVKKWEGPEGVVFRNHAFKAPSPEQESKTWVGPEGVVFRNHAFKAPSAEQESETWVFE